MNLSQLAWLALPIFPMAVYFSVAANPQFSYFEADAATILSRPPWPQTSTPDVRLNSPGRNARMFRANPRRTGHFGEVPWELSDLVSLRVAIGNSGIHTASKAAPVADSAGMVWTTDNGAIAKTNAKGELQWGRSLFDSDFGSHSTPASDSNYLYLSSYNGFTDIVEQKSGASVMRIFTANAIGASPLLLGDQLIQAVETFEPNGYVYRWDLTANRAVWVSSWLGEHAHSSVTFDPLSGGLFVGANNGRFVALDFLTGALRWSFKAEKAVKSTAVVVGNLVYFSSNDGKLRALDTKSGQLQWEFKIRDGAQNSPAYSASLDSIFVFDEAANICRLEAKSGKLLWRKDRGVAENGSSPVLFKSKGREVLGVACEKDAFCLMDANRGELLKKFPLDSRLNGEVTVFEKGILIATFSGASQWLQAGN